MNMLISEDDLIFEAKCPDTASSSIGIPLLQEGHTKVLWATCTEMDLDYGLSYLRKIPRGE